MDKSDRIKSIIKKIEQEIGSREEMWYLFFMNKIKEYLGPSFIVKRSRHVDILIRKKYTEDKKEKYRTIFGLEVKKILNMRTIGQLYFYKKKYDFPVAVLMFKSYFYFAKEYFKNIIKEDFDIYLYDYSSSKFIPSLRNIYEKGIEKFFPDLLELEKKIRVDLNKKDIKKWTDEEIDYLLENYGSTTALELTNKLDRTEGSVKGMLSRLKIKKIPEYVKYMSDKEFEQHLKIAKKSGLKPF
jgi:hypothetical protein